MFALLSLHCSLLSRLNRLGFLDELYTESQAMSEVLNMKEIYEKSLGLLD